MEGLNMLYFRKNDDVIEKYQVNFDKEKIKKLKQEIINNCSFITHIECESDYTPILSNEIVRNFTYTPTGKEREYFEETRDIYHYSYDRYEPPYLVALINQLLLLNDNSKVIDQILNYEIASKSTIDDKIELAYKEFKEIDPENATKKVEKLKELENLLKAKKLNINQQNIDLYYNQLIELIKFNLIDSLPINELNKIESFLEINLSSEVEISDSNKKPFVKSLIY